MSRRTTSARRHVPSGYRPPRGLKKKVVLTDKERVGDRLYKSWTFRGLTRQRDRVYLMRRVLGRAPPGSENGRWREHARALAGLIDFHRGGSSGIAEFVTMMDTNGRALFSAIVNPHPTKRNARRTLDVPASETVLSDQDRLSIAKIVRENNLCVPFETESRIAFMHAVRVVTGNANAMTPVTYGRIFRFCSRFLERIYSDGTEAAFQHADQQRKTKLFNIADNQMFPANIIQGEVFRMTLLSTKMTRTATRYPPRELDESDVYKTNRMDILKIGRFILVHFRCSRYERPYVNLVPPHRMESYVSYLLGD